MSAHPLRHRPALLGTLLGLAMAVALLTAPAARANPDPGSGIDPATSVTVTQLGLTNGTGWITVHVHVGIDLLGFAVDVPAGTGRWVTPPDVYVPDLAMHCLAGPDRDLHYLCARSLEPDPSNVLPVGYFEVALPVSRVGGYAGLVGSTTMHHLVGLGAGGPLPYDLSQSRDTFAVVDASTDYRSTAEAIALNESHWPRHSYLPETVFIAPGEPVWAITTVLPLAGGVFWKFLSVAAPAFLQCQPQPGSRHVLAVHCNAVSGGRIPAGRFTMVIKVSVFTYDESGPPGTVALTIGDNPPQVQDTFGAYFQPFIPPS